MKGLLKKYGIEDAPRLHSVEHADAKSLAAVLAKELPQTVALTIAHCPPAKAADIIKLLPEALRTDVLGRIAVIDTVDPEHLAQIDEALHDALQKLPPLGKLGGSDAVARLLSVMEPSLQKQLIEKLEKADPDILKTVMDKLVPFEFILKVHPLDIQRLIPQFTPRDWAVALKNAEPRLVNFLMKNMSAGAAANLKDEISALPLIRLSEVNTIQKKIIEAFRTFLET